MPPPNDDRAAGRAADVLACFEQVPAILWSFEGPELRVVAANAGARASVGDRPGILGRPIREVLPELEGQQIFEMMDSAYRDGRSVSAADRRVLVDRDGDGRLEEGFFTYSVIPTFHDDGSVRGLVVHIVETTTGAQRTAAAERRVQHASEIVLELQRSLLPSVVPVLPELAVAGHYRVAGDELAAGGDWFDAVSLPDGRIALVVGDVVGHGARAAGAMGQLRAVLLDALQGLDAPDGPAALQRLDRFAGHRGATRAATVCLAVLDPATGAAAVAGHGHPAPLVVDTGGAVRTVEMPGSAPLGTGGGPAEWVPVVLAVGDTLVLHSDGLVERTGHPPTEGRSALADTLGAACRDTADGVLDVDTSLPVLPVERLVTVLVERMEFLADGFGDDVTVLAAQRRGPVAPLSTRQPAVRGSVGPLRQSLRGWLDTLGAGEDDVEALVHAVGEAVANAVQHAYPDAVGPDTVEQGTVGQVEVHGRLDEAGTAQLEVSDTGRWRPPTAEEAGVGRVEGGRGVQMMRELCDDVVVEPGPAGTTVRLRRRLRRPVGVTRPGAAPRRRPTRSEELDVQVDEASATAVVTGPVDLATVGRLRARLLHLARGGLREVRVDLSGVTVLSSVGVALLHELAASVPGLSLVVVPGDISDDVLRMVGLGRLVATGADLLPAGGGTS